MERHTTPPEEIRISGNPDAGEYISMAFETSQEIEDQIKETLANHCQMTDIQKLPSWFRDMMPQYYIDSYGEEKAWEMWLSHILKEGITSFKERRTRSANKDRPIVGKKQEWKPEQKHLSSRQRINRMSAEDMLEHSVMRYREALDVRDDTKNLPVERKEEMAVAFRAREEKMAGVMTARNEALNGPDRDKVLKDMEARKQKEWEHRKLAEEEKELVNYKKILEEVIDRKQKELQLLELQVQDKKLEIEQLQSKFAIKEKEVNEKIAAMKAEWASKNDQQQ